MPKPDDRGRQSKSSDRFSDGRLFLASAWACHFAVSIAIIALGNNRYEEDRKYIPIDANSLQGDRECFKAYANVLASSVTDDGAIVCCTRETGGDHHDGICRPPSPYLFLARHLTRLPEACLLPLFPLLIRWLVLRFSKRQSNGVAVATNTDGSVSKRFALYVGLMVLRLSILYVLFDKIEDLLVPPSGTGCWYDGFLRNHQDTCHGKATDYSDHTVLFFAQTLPIALTEVLVSFVAPYWINNRIVVLRNMVPTILVAGLFYLYLVTFFAAYKTAAYFHTRFETGVGYAISLCIQIPLFVVTSTSYMEPIRDYFFDCGSNDHDKKP